VCRALRDPSEVVPDAQLVGLCSSLASPVAHRTITPHRSCQPADNHSKIGRRRHQTLDSSGKSGPRSPREGLLRAPPRFQEAREVAALPELGDAQLDGPGADLPVPAAIAVALHQPIRRALAIAGAGQGRHLGANQALGREADHLTKRSASLLFSTSWQRAILSSVIVVVSGPGLLLATRSYGDPRGERPLRHQSGRDPRLSLSGWDHSTTRRHVPAHYPRTITISRAQSPLGRVVASWEVRAGHT
jgi:hypothetical protein